MAALDLDMDMDLNLDLDLDLSPLGVLSLAPLGIYTFDFAPAPHVVQMRPASVEHSVLRQFPRGSRGHGGDGGDGGDRSCLTLNDIQNSLQLILFRMHKYKQMGMPGERGHNPGPLTTILSFSCLGSVVQSSPDYNSESKLERYQRPSISELYKK
ncbi:hypothetical protein ACLKA6_015973 [Drosophila palustris]